MVKRSLFARHLPYSSYCLPLSQPVQRGKHKAEYKKACETISAENYRPETEKSSP